MDDVPARLHDTVIACLRQAPWKDARHLDTLAWMVVGLLIRGTIHISGWMCYVRSRARQAQSVERRHQRELMEQGFQLMDKRLEALRGEMNKRFEQVDKRFEALTRRIDRFMIWSFGVIVGAGGLVVAAIKYLP